MRKRNFTKKKHKKEHVDIQKNIKKNYYRSELKRDYLKYFRLARRYTQRKYKLSLTDLEVLLFLQSEFLFTKEDMDEISLIVPWDKKRFKRLKENGWIHTWREPKPYMKAQYEVTSKTKNMVEYFCRILEGDRRLTENHKKNEYMKRARYTDKVYARAIEKMNKKLNNYD